MITNIKKVLSIDLLFKKRNSKKYTCTHIWHINLLKETRSKRDW